LLSVEKLNVYYGKSHVIHDLSFSVRHGESVALMGRNGMGKTVSMPNPWLCSRRMSVSRVVLVMCRRVG
jgi:ABC-type molybdenum transport system ATPase subunit/photorepair protein PhrA